MLIYTSFNWTANRMLVKLLTEYLYLNEWINKCGAEREVCLCSKMPTNKCFSPEKNIDFKEKNSNLTEISDGHHLGPVNKVESTNIGTNRHPSSPVMLQMTRTPHHFCEISANNAQTEPKHRTSR